MNTNEIKTRADAFQLVGRYLRSRHEGVRDNVDTLEAAAAGYDFLATISSCPKYERRQATKLRTRAAWLKKARKDGHAAADAEFGPYGAR